MRLIIVDRDVELSGLDSEPFAVLEMGKEYAVSELYDNWSRMDFAERELQAERFSMTKRRIQARKLISELSRIHIESGIIPEPGEEAVDAAEEHESAKDIATSVAKPDESSPAADDQRENQAGNAKIPEKISERIGWFLGQKEVRFLMIVTGIVALLVGCVIGKII